MSEQQLIKDILLEGEGDDLEFRSKVSKEGAAEVICSFLNAKGGRLVIGLGDNKDVLGISNAHALAKELQFFLLESIIPEAPINISVESLDNKDLVMLKVYGGSKQPYIFDGSIFFRKNGRTVRANSEQISKLIHGRQLAELHWERQGVVGVGLDQLDLNLIRSTIRESKENHRGFYSGDDELDFLAHYGLYQNGSFTNACIVLFAKDPVRYIPQIRVRLTEYSSEGKTDQFLNRDEVLEGNLFEIHRRLEQYIVNLGTRSVFDKNQWKRVDWKFPNKALQEGIVNALLHRDYSSFSSGVSISIYPDQFVISNSGHLPDDLTVGELKKSHRSHPTNPDIAHMFFLRGLIDKLGRGTLKVLEECKLEGLKQPAWKDSSEGISLTFFGPRALAAKRSEESLNLLVDNLDDGISDGLIEGVNQLVDEAINDGLIDGISESIRLEVIRIVKLILKHEGANIQDLVVKRGKSKATIERYVRTAKEVGVLEFIGSNKTGGYFLSSKLKRMMVDGNDI